MNGILRIKRNGFKERYRDEFEDKIELLYKIMAEKRERVKVTWISMLRIKKKYNV